MKILNKKIRILSLLVLLLLFLPFVYAASLPSFMIVSGTVTVHGMDVVPTTTIKAYIEGDSDPLVEDGTAIVETPGQYSIVITGDLFLDNGKTIVFKVNDTQVDESTIFFPMAIVELNLNVGFLPEIFGDVNGDGEVNILDLILTRRQFGKTPDDSDWNDYYDMNDDGAINILDLILVRRNFT